MFCQSCGSETPDQGEFCISCGIIVNKKCPDCAEWVKVEARKCRFCGYKFRAEDFDQIKQRDQERQQAQLDQKLEHEKKEREEAMKREKEIEIQKRKETEQKVAVLDKKRRELQARLTDHLVNPRIIILGFGPMVLQCQQCGTLSEIHTIICRGCDQSLLSAPKIKNPYYD